jgi:hypothetical protein
MKERKKKEKKRKREKERPKLVNRIYIRRKKKKGQSLPTAQPISNSNNGIWQYSHSRLARLFTKKKKVKETQLPLVARGRLSRTNQNLFVIV